MGNVDPFEDGVGVEKERRQAFMNGWVETTRGLDVSARVLSQRNITKRFGTHASGHSSDDFQLNRKNTTIYTS